ncbi:MAG: phosphoribosyltransferase family protein [Ferruginibacter sp.]
MAERKYILSKEVAAKKLRRLALEVVENNYDEPQLVLIGIRDNGIVIANTISEHLKEIFHGSIIVMELSLNKKRPAEITLSDAIDFNDKAVLLIDDVANSGSTMLYALKPLLETYPKKIQTLALVERTHKSFPIDVDYVGLSVSTTTDEHIFVEVSNNEVQGAWIDPKNPA